MTILLSPERALLRRRCWSSAVIWRRSVPTTRWALGSRMYAVAASFGASLAWIPIAREITRRVIELAINLACEAILGGA